VRHFGLVQQLPYGEVVARAERGEHREHLLLLDEPDRVVHRAARVVAVVEVDELELAPEDAALRVDVVEVRIDPARDVAGDRRFAAQRDARADLDLGRADAGRGQRSSRLQRPAHKGEGLSPRSYDLLYSRVVSGPKSLRSAPPTPVASRISTTISTAPKITSCIPGRCGLRFTCGMWLIQPVTSSA